VLRLNFFTCQIIILSYPSRLRGAFGNPKKRLVLRKHDSVTGVACNRLRRSASLGCLTFTSVKTREGQIEGNLATYVGVRDPPCSTPELGPIWRLTR
jgi:hypothetical protein